MDCGGCAVQTPSSYAPHGDATVFSRHDPHGHPPHPTFLFFRGRCETESSNTASISASAPSHHPWKGKALASCNAVCSTRLLAVRVSCFSANDWNQASTHSAPNNPCISSSQPTALHPGLRRSCHCCVPQVARHPSLSFTRCEQKESTARLETRRAEGTLSLRPVTFTLF